MLVKPVSAAESTKLKEIIPAPVTPTKKQDKPKQNKPTRIIPTPFYTPPVDLRKVYVTSEYSYYHPGIDLAPIENQASPDLLAIAKGTVIYADDTSFDMYTDDYGGYGKTVVIDHHNGLYSLYAHLKSISVKAGQKITKGKKIGILGTTGNSTGPHLHIEVCSNECRGWLAQKHDPGEFFDISHLTRGS